MLSPSLDGEPGNLGQQLFWLNMGGGSDLHGQNSSSTANIENNLILEDVFVLHNGIHV
jgi:hypothetical protein